MKAKFLFWRRSAASASYTATQAGFSNGETPNRGFDTPTSLTGQPPAEQHVLGQTSIAQRVSG